MQLPSAIWVFIMFFGAGVVTIGNTQYQLSREREKKHEAATRAIGFTPGREADEGAKNSAVKRASQSDKDALDVLRLLRGTETDDLAARYARLLADQRAQEAATSGRSLLEAQFAKPDFDGRGAFEARSHRLIRIVSRG